MSESNQLTKCARRKFLARGVVAACFGALVPLAKAESETQVTAETYLGSASDAIIMLLDLLLSVQGEAYMEAGNKLRRESLRCAASLQALFDEIDKLVGKIKTKKSAHASATRRMKELVELGRRSTQLLPRSIDTHGGNVTVLLASLSVITDQVSQTAQGLLPPGDIVLDDDEKKTLERIIGLVHQAREIPAATKDAEKEFGTLALQIGSIIDSVRNDIFDASSFAEADDAKKALERITAAIATLQALMKNVAFSTAATWSGTKAMIQCLEGAAKWVEVGPKSTPITVDEKGAIKLSSEKRKHHSGIGTTLSTGWESIPSPSQGVGGLLGSVCKPNNWSRRSACYWAAGMAWLRHPQDPNGRIFVLNGALLHLACESLNDKGMLIKALAGA